MKNISTIIKDRVISFKTKQGFLKQVKRISHLWLWIIAGAAFGLLVLAPLLMILMKYHFDKHLFPFKEVTINFYREAGNIDFVSGSLFVLFLLIGGTLSYFLFRIRTGINKNNSEATFSDILLKGESNTIEFKSSFRWDYRLQKTSKEIEFAGLKTIAAFMNSAGGILLIGVDDNASIIGLEKDYETLKKGNRDGFEQYIMQSVAVCLGTENCKNVQVSFVVSNDKDVCMIKVENIKSPAFLKNQQNTHFFVRAGNGTRELNIKEALKYIKASTRY